ncbi:MAG: response regulator [Sandaracinus sp.]|nr:response regulator [Myxococcales bacterium]MCB9601746.1 response regulator [Sandaracinus sp.]MCB9614233.1 response regulator [Sandaracinus sp.]MCB9634367.1 response regulator [Sandaracinus sp.]
MTRRLTVLLIEDDDDFRELLEASLRWHGFEVLAFACAPHVPDLLGQVDVALVDQRLPGRSGLSVLAELREVDADVPTLLMSGFADADLVRAAKSLGAVGVFAKPFDLGHLVAALQLVSPRPR